VEARACASHPIPLLLNASPMPLCILFFRWEVDTFEDISRLPRRNEKELSSPNDVLHSRALFPPPPTHGKGAKTLRLFKVKEALFTTSSETRDVCGGGGRECQKLRSPLA